MAGLFIGPCAILGIVLGALSASAAHKNKQRASVPAAWGIGPGAAFAVLWVIALILLISVLAAASAAISSYPTG